MSSQALLAPAWATLDPIVSLLYKSRSSQKHDQCQPTHDWVSLSLSTFLCFGLVVSYLPQILRIVTRKSSLGFSPWFLLLGATSSASSFLNVVALQWGVVRCCARLTAGQCLESLLGVIQVGLQWLLFVTVLVLYLVYYPTELRYERSIALPKDDSRAGVTEGDLEDEEDDDDSIGDIDSLGSHIANNYSTFDENASSISQVNAARAADGSGAAGQSTYTNGDYEDSPDASAFASRFAGVEDNNNASSSAFDRLVPTFWPVWKAPANKKKVGPSRLGASSVTPSDSARSSGPQSLADVAEEIEPASTSSQPRVAFERNDANAALLGAPRSRRRGRRVKHKSAEWSLALALGWVVVLHFIFIFSVTILLVSTLPPSAFPAPHNPDLPIPTPSPGNGTVPGEGKENHPSWDAYPGNGSGGGASSRLLLSRWATFLGITGTLLAAAQYIPQIIHTFQIRLVQSLSIPTMLLQVPGSVIFVYALAVRPGIDWTSLAAYVCTGVLQLALLILCTAWKVRQKKESIDDYGRPVDAEGRLLEREEEEDDFN